MKKNTNSKKPLIPFISWSDICKRYSQKNLFTFKKEDNSIQVLNGQKLADNIIRLGSILQHKLVSQKKSLIILTQGLEYVYTVLACFYANVVAIPISITSTEKNEKTIEKISHILRDSQASLIISDTTLIEYLQLNQVYNSVSILNVEEMNQDSAIIKEQRPYEPDNMAMLLYTSGSTSQPKGVILSHSNIINQASQGAAQWGISESSRIVSWMPQFHNFGLYLNILSPLIKGASSVILSPSHFVTDPQIWFETIDEYQATHTGAPNFAFDLCYSSIQIEFVKNLSLNSLEAIICGGEPIRKETYMLFSEKFKSLGLKKNVFCPHYGMSEVGSITTKNSSKPICFKSLYLTELQQRKVKFTNQKNKSKSVASCGEIGENTRILIVNPDNCELCLPDEIGEIWVKSSSVGLGYLNTTEETMTSFYGALSNGEEIGFFRTGDLGFIKDNQLYVVGREKEVIVVHGKKHYAVDIEWTIKNNIPSLTLPISVFSYETDYREKVVVIQEVENIESENIYKGICKEILTIVSENHNLEIDKIAFVNKGSIPRTGSGKILRNGCRNLYLNKGFKFIYQYNYEHSTSTIKDDTSNKCNENDICSILENEVFLHILKVSEDRLNTVSSFSEFGLDSIQYIRISRKIEDIFHIKFAPVNLFKYQNIEQLANYIRFQLEKTQSQPQPFNTGREEDDLVDNLNENDIAIIGMSCNFPGGADDPDTFWNNIIQNKDSITSVEQSRMQILRDYKNTYADLNESFPQFGGFVNDIEAFDAHFFNISPLEAECMDPQQRKVMELTWSVIESSGYNPHSFGGQNVGLFMGVHNNDYMELIARQPELMELYGAYLDSGLHMSLITHRVSRWFDFHGPSEVINTACSSSLVAVHHAIESIYKKESSVAIAGGVNLISAARIYIASHKAGMLSKNGKCKTFDQEADGFVRSEGYGAVLLKPYSQSLKDKDNILGIIKASAINHDGHSNSLRAPNFNAQKNLLKSIYNRPGIDPNTISYVETHGTGTPIGDPIEVQALQEAFLEINPYITNGLCGLGSVKTNIGHCESASGIASLIKVLLSMKHKTLPGILHFKKLNPYIQMENSPFYIVEEEKSWQRLKKGDGSEFPRRAGISSFGFGGANAHIVVEENIPAYSDRVLFKYGNSHGKSIIPVSSRDEKCLKESVRKLHTFLIKSCEGSRELKDLDDGRLQEIAYTLQEGREAMEVRVAFLTADIDELIEKLYLFLNDELHIEDFWKGNVNEKGDLESLIGDVEDTQKTIEKWLEEGKMDKVAQFWVKGGFVDWKMQYNEQPKRVYLPTYPFTKTYYWIPDNDKSLDKNSEISSVKVVHPLLQKNTSTFFKQKFSSIFNGRESFVADHIVKGQPVVPGAALIEMACAAIQESFDTKIGESVGIRFKNIVWTQPMVIESKPVNVVIELYTEENKEISYEIYSTNENEEDEISIHCQGNAFLNSLDETLFLDIASLLAECNKSIIYSEECYKYFKSMGITYGSTQQGIKEIYIGDGKVLAKLMLPLESLDTSDKIVLHPAILDAAFQSTIGLTSRSAELAGNKLSNTLIPFAIEQLEVYGKYTSNVWAVIKYSKGNSYKEKIHKFDIDLCDENGNVCVRIVGFSLREIKEELGSEIPQEEPGYLMLHMDWKEKTIDKTNTIHNYSKHFVFLCEYDEISEKDIETCLNGVECIVLKSEEDRIDTRFIYYFIKLFETIQNIMKETPKNEVLIQIVFPKDEQQLFEGLVGLLRTAQMENPKIIGQAIGMDPKENLKGIVEKLKENSKYTVDNQIKYSDGKRLVSCLMESSDLKNENIIFKNNGIYLITGGMGGIGFIFAKEIINTLKHVTLILTGRSNWDDYKQKKIREVTNNGANIVYMPVDVSDKQAVSDLMSEIRDKFGNINGIIHSAGVIKDNFIIKKSIDEAEQVLAPKVSGVVNLDYESKDMEIDFFVTFSSIAGVMGNIGQADYSAANAFMDAFAEYRNTLVNLKQRSGKTVSVNWPLWKDGGMRVDEVTERMMEEKIGMCPMDSSIGISTFYQALKSGYSQEIIVYGKPQKIKSVLLAPSIEGNIGSTALTIDERKVIVQIEEDSFKEKTKEYLKTLLSSVIRLPASQINADEPMEKYGIDSVMVIQLTNKLEKTFGPLSKTLFFEFTNISALAGYFTESYRDKLKNLLDIETKPIEITEKNIGSKDEFKKTTKLSENRVGNNWFISTKTARTVQKEHFDIAIIGVSGRYPGANSIDDFWKVLKEGTDCITEIPKDRWDHSIYYNPDKNMNGKTYSKWGGFIDDVDKFEPLFFNISPHEAELMDPQERLFLQCAYESMEDAGYTRETFEKYYNMESEEKVGVFAGVMFDEYQLYGAQETVKGRPIAFAGSSASIANRVSYFLNLNGPSMTVNTMCSSSLTAIHLACQSIQCGECSFAFAGGVNVSIHPNKYLLLAQGKFASSKGRCESFGQGGDGYVPGEGVGVVLLKPMFQAIKDNDNIYGVIKGTSINHGGKTNGFTVPNPVAQGNVILKALEKAEVDPRTVSYIEAHGTGTSLGDPIEISGLTKAFEKYTNNMQFCAIGSVKSNIGHCESAAGIAGLTKILLQLKYKQLVPSLHSKQLNPNIDFIETPFVVQQELASWDRPVVKINGEGKQYPRRAGISSFGAGGSNAHIIIEEYIVDKSKGFEGDTSNGKPVVFVLSAKSEVQLTEIVRKLLHSIQENQFNDNLLRDMAYTLQTGREAMNVRLAIIVKSIIELEEKLKGILDNQYGINTYQGQTKHNKETFNIFEKDEDLQEVVDRWISKERYEKLLQFWVRGLNIDWNKLYTENRPNRISLPTYPFAKERYWAVKSEDISGNSKQDYYEKRSKCFLHKQWEQSLTSSSREIIGTVAVLVTMETLELGKKVAQYFPKSEILELDNLQLQLDYPQEAWKNYGGVIDLIGCNMTRNDSMDWIIWLQKLIEHGSKGSLVLLCVTKGLETYRNNTINLSGSTHVGLYRMLQSEYSHIRSRHMDADFLDNDNELSQQIYSEFLADSEDVEICYRIENAIVLCWKK